MSQTVENELSHSVDDSFKKFLDMDRHANYFQNIISFSSSQIHL